MNKACADVGHPHAPCTLFNINVESWKVTRYIGKHMDAVCALCSRYYFKRNVCDV